LVGELQSDLHQAGREKGYETPELKNALKEYESLVIKNANGQKLTPNEMARVQELKPMVSGKSGGVPDAPFKDNWYQLALKRVLKYAADNGYERVGLTTGKQQAKRYDLGNEVTSIDVESVEGVPNLQLVDIDVIGGQKIALEVENGVVREGEFAGKRLSDVVGKEMADKITNVAQGKTKSLAGEDLRLGGEGMKKYYDEIYPKFLEKYGKKWDAGVGETQLKGTASKDELAAQVYGRGETYRNLPSENRRKIDQMYLARGEPIRYIDITPKMKESVGKGQPLFTAIPAGTLGLGGLEYADPFANTIGSSIR